MTSGESARETGKEIIEKGEGIWNEALKKLE